MPTASYSHIEPARVNNPQTTDQKRSVIIAFGAVMVSFTRSLNVTIPIVRYTLSGKRVSTVHLKSILCRKKDHIEAFWEAKEANEYSDMDKQNKLVGAGLGIREKMFPSSPWSHRPFFQGKNKCINSQKT
jgi:hypothetical protein